MIFATPWLEREDLYADYSEEHHATHPTSSTLACVLGVVDLYGLTESVRVVFTQDLNALFGQITQSIQNKAYPFDVLEFSESSNRMLQHQDMYGKLTISRGYVHLNEPALEDPTPIDSLQYLYKLQGYLHKVGLFRSNPGVAPLLAICDEPKEVENGKGLSC